MSALHDDEHFRFVGNGELSLESFPEDLLPYRFLLSHTMDERRLDAELVKTELEARARDLASPAGLLLEPWFARDPTLELLKVVEGWQPLHEPRREFDVWFDRAGARALLIAETRAPAFDPGRQRAALDALEQSFAVIDERGDLGMIVSGTGKFSAVMETRTRAEAGSLGRAATIGMIVLLLLAYRRLGSLVLTLLPLVSAALAGLAAVSALFGSVHGITLAFGFTLIGVAQDYPIHLLSHSRPNVAPREVARSLWATLATGVAGTCVAYATFLFSGVLGLAQLAVFTVAGLAVAGLTTRFLLPMLVGASHDRGDSRLLRRLSSAIGPVPHPVVAGMAVIVATVAVIVVAPQRLWDNDLSGLTPVPADLLAQDRELRSELGTADFRYLLVVHAGEEQAALAAARRARRAAHGVGAPRCDQRLRSRRALCARGDHATRAPSPLAGCGHAARGCRIGASADAVSPRRLRAVRR